MESTQEIDCLLLMFHIDAANLISRGLSLGVNLLTWAVYQVRERVVDMVRDE